jgi:hypothetical protein
MSDRCSYCGVRIRPWLSRPSRSPGRLVVPEVPSRRPLEFSADLARVLTDPNESVLGIAFWRTGMYRGTHLRSILVAQTFARRAFILGRFDVAMSTGILRPRQRRAVSLLSLPAL